MPYIESHHFAIKVISSTEVGKGFPGLRSFTTATGQFFQLEISGDDSGTFYMTS